MDPQMDLLKHRTRIRPVSQSEEQPPPGPPTLSSLFPPTKNRLQNRKKNPYATVGFNLLSSFKGFTLSSPYSSSSPYLNGELGPIRIGQPTSVSFPLELPLTIESAHKKGAGSTKNGRDSRGKRLGVKIYGDQAAQPGAIIVRQRGTKFHPGNNVGLGKDHTIFSLIDGMVKFEKYGPDRKKVSVYPRIEQPENPNSFKARRREYFRLQRERKKARKEGVLPPQLVLASAEDVSKTNPAC